MNSSLQNPNVDVTKNVRCTTHYVWLMDIDGDDYCDRWWLKLELSSIL